MDEVAQGVQKGGCGFELEGRDAGSSEKGRCDDDCIEGDAIVNLFH